MSSLRISTVNTQTLTNPRKMFSVLATVKNESIVCLTENNFSNVHWLTNIDQKFHKDFKLFHSFVNQRGTGVSLLFNHSLLGSGFRKVWEIPGRAIAVCFKQDRLHLLVIGVYAPATPNDRPEFYRKVEDALRGDIVYDKYFMLGDFNLVENPAVDRSTSNRPMDVCLDEFLRVKNFIN